MTWLLVALAGGAGAWCRFHVDDLVNKALRAPVTVGTLVVNATGSFALGLLVGWLSVHTGPADVRLVLGTGFLGGYTTFSTAAVEIVDLVLAKRRGAAFSLAAAMVLVGLVAAVAGYVLGRV